MRSDASHLRFLRNARWRWSVWRVLESAGLGASAIGMLGIMPVGVLVWRGEDAVLIALVLLTIGAICGALWGAMHRPSLAQTSMRADQQLGLHDLLSTALTARSWRDEAFRDVVLAQADAVCRERSASEVIVRRLSGRAWGVIGIVSSLLLTISMMSNGPAGIAATSADGSERTVQKVDDASRAALGDLESPPMTRATDPAGLSGRPGPSPADEQDPDRSAADGSRSAAGGGSRQNLAMDAPGEAEGRTSGARVDRAERTQLPSPSDTSPDGSLTAAGGQATITQQGTRSEAASPTARGAAAPTRTSPWAASSEPTTDRDRADQEIRSRRVPDAYRDVVREYFQVTQ